MDGLAGVRSVRLDDLEELRDVLAVLPLHDERWMATREAVGGADAGVGGAGMRCPGPDLVLPVVRRALDAVLGRPSRRLACYGTLRPGETHAEVLGDLRGTWTDGEVSGVVSDWEGYPRLEWSSGGGPVPVRVLESTELETAWSRIDSFEGPAYVRSLVPVSTGDGAVVAACYLAVP